jgi:hypothetical protein
LAELKLARLPDRTPVKITVTIGAELHQMLKDYADLYQTTYGSTEQVVDLIPFMLEAFVQSDKGFTRTGKR